MPPFLLISSAIISAAAFPGTPNTEAGPDRNVVMPILISAGLPCARTGPVSIAAATPAASAVFRNCIETSLGSIPTFLRPGRPSLEGDCAQLRGADQAAGIVHRAAGDVGFSRLNRNFTLRYESRKPTTWTALQGFAGWLRAADYFRPVPQRRCRK